MNRNDAEGQSSIDSKVLTVFILYACEHYVLYNKHLNSVVPANDRFCNSVRNPAKILYNKRIIPRVAPLSSFNKCTYNKIVWNGN